MDERENVVGNQKKIQKARGKVAWLVQGALPPVPRQMSPDDLQPGTSCCSALGSPKTSFGGTAAARAGAVTACGTPAKNIGKNHPVLASAAGSCEEHKLAGVHQHKCEIPHPDAILVQNFAPYPSGARAFLRFPSLFLSLRRWEYLVSGWIPACSPP